RVLVRAEPLATREVIDEVLSSIPERATKERIQVEIDVAPEAETIRADNGLVRRVLFHLLSNAFKFTAEGTVTVAVQPTDEPGAASLWVRPPGGAAPAGLVGGLSEISPRPAAWRPRRHNGLGMGLTLVQRCVRLLGGDLEVESRPHQGSEFRVRLPHTLPTA